MSENGQNGGIKMGEMGLLVEILLIIYLSYGLYLWIVENIFYDPNDGVYFVTMLVKVFLWPFYYRK